MSPRVRFEPIGEEIDCGARETVLDAAFRHGYNLVYGCREGQCSACKCFLLEGDAALARYSNFALSDSERTSGYTLMCRAMPEQDLVIELLHYDPENYRLEHEIREGEAVVQALEALTHDITRLVLGADGFDFTPGQYIDVHVPGAGGARRSFSMANLPGENRIELMIKRYPGGRLSGLLDGQIKVGDRLKFTGPYGALRVHAGRRPIVMIAGGSGMAPILSLLRSLAAGGDARGVHFFYGARTERDLFHLEEIRGLALSNLTFTPVVERFVHEAVEEWLTASDVCDLDVYMCGPPPMIEAAEAMLARHGVDEQRIFVDKFTTAADAVLPDAQQESERDFDWYQPRARRASLYEDVTVDTQPSVHRHLRRGWPLSFEDGRGTWDDRSTALHAEDWFAFRDPAEQWERTFYQSGNALEREIEDAMGFLEEVSPEWVETLRRELQVAAFVEHGLWFALATIARDCLSDTVATCVCLQAAMKQRSAQAIVLYAMDLERLYGPFPIEDARERWLHDERWQPTRRFVERLAATPDWGEVILATNLAFEPVVGALLRDNFGMRMAARHGDTVTPVLARAAAREWQWVRGWTEELVRLLIPANRETIERWLGEWRPRAIEAASALDPQFEDGRDLDGAAWTTAAGESTKRTRPAPTPLVASVASEPDGGAGYDYVGIVMAKSAEGDAVAAILGAQEGVQVIEQPAFYDIRAKVRLAIKFAEVSGQLGYEIDAYSIQREMSTHYGRMVATDDALMLFSDPTEAMGHLMS